MTDCGAVMTLLRKVPLFANLKDEDKVCIEETEEWRLPEGQLLVEEGKHASAITLSADEALPLDSKLSGPGAWPRSSLRRNVRVIR